MPPIDTGRIEAAVAEILAAIGEDAQRPGLLTTPQRVAEAYAEFFAGVGVDPVPLLRDELATQDAPEQRGEIVLLRDIALRSICEHHLLPFTGVAHVAYLPAERLVGLGSIARTVETLASRPQLQERLGEDIVAAIDAALAPLGALVVIDARHGCVGARGPRQAESTTVTVAASGALADPVRRAEVMALIGGGVA
ncbi:GTP cyclohydrolase I [Microcella humidisoli]|jgi:GTP cyclohydrolase I|uniref:GTP cyclohydrolase 1 n=1 Tax=Microcella humidisoli TaxID=2963406 RepID=A0ABY5G025_9MICO|nr:GTP cyclohydrolase I [Microcella humidisoli]UTT63306.1 GTP cyclohydrolase I [Microcella humidisoli]